LLNFKSSVVALDGFFIVLAGAVAITLSYIAYLAFWVKLNCSFEVAFGFPVLFELIKQFATVDVRFVELGIFLQALRKLNKPGITIRSVLA